MAKYQITHACGHTVTHNIVGTNVRGEREQRAEWLAARPCQDCHRKQQQERAAEANKGLPALVGTEKQIAWAEQIRAKAASSLLPIREMIDARRDLEPTQANVIITVIDNALAQTDSRYWIDNRDASFDGRWIKAQAK